MTVNKRTINITALIIFLSTFVVYIWTLCPSVYVGDSAELITAACNEGIAHPPGYPLYVVMGKIFSFLPVRSMAYRVNMLSAFFSAITAGLVFFILILIFKGKTKADTSFDALLSSITGSLCLAFSSIFWSQAVVAEVFPINGFFFALLILLVVLYQQSGRQYDNSYACLIGFICGLGLTNHQTLVFTLPVIAFIIIEKLLKSGRPQVSSILKMLVFFITGISFYLFLLVRSRSHPVINWDMPDNIERFLRVILRSGYGTFKLSETGLLNLSLSAVLFKMQLFFQNISNQFTIFGFIIGIAGMAYSIIRKNTARHLLIFLFMFTGILFFLIASPTKDIAGIEVMKRFYLMPFVVFSIWIGIGIKYIQEIIPFKRIKVLFVIPILFIVIIIFAHSNYRVNDRSRNYISYDYGMNIFKTLDKDSTLFVEKWDETIFILSYLKTVEKVRPDVQLYDCHASLLKNIYGGDYIYLRGKGRDQRRKEVETAIIASTDKQVYYATMEEKSIIGLELIPEGMLYRVNKPGYKPVLTDYDRVYETRDIYDSGIFKEYRINLLASTYPYLLSKYYFYYRDKERTSRELYKLSTMENAEGLLFELGTYFLTAGNNRLALNAYELVLKTNPGFADVYCNLGVLYEREQKSELAVKSYRQAIKLKPDYEQAHYNLGVVYWKQNKWALVVKEFEETLRINPGYEQVRRFLPEARRHAALLKERLTADR